ncbi:MAG: DUF2169 domain-containing protein [Gammaproteobacteria bacterium]|nr:DUF2169 domain-containing protein [Gammaproteobacteria bacterium]
MLQLNNKTPFAAAMSLFPNPQGVDTMYAMVKASFNIGPKWTLLDEQIPPVEADIYWGEPESSSIKYASDYHTGKPSTDIIVTGLACAAEQQMVKQLDVGLSVGRVSKNIRVYGDRQWFDGRISEPAPFKTMPLVYEKSFGGMHLVEGEVDSADARNPLGIGFAGNRSAKQMNGVPLPNLEDPRDLISEHSQTPMPACFGYCSPAWEPRVSYAGTYDETWQTQRAPYLPEDFDSRFFNMAHPDLVYPGYLQGGEVISITGMHPGGALNFELPEVKLVSQFKIKDKLNKTAFNLETLHIEPNLLQLSMIWRASYPCDKKALKIDEIKVSLNH